MQKNIFDYYSNTLTAIFLFAIGTVVSVGARQIVPIFEGMGADILPTVIGGGLLLMACLLIPDAISEIKAGQARKAAGVGFEVIPEEEPTDSDGNPIYISEMRMKLTKIAVPLSLILFNVYCFSMQSLGFIVSSMIFVFLISMLLTLKVDRNMRAIIATTILAPIIVYFIFAVGFSINVPKGILSAIL